MLLDRDIRDRLGSLPGSSTEPEPEPPQKRNPRRPFSALAGALLALWAAGIGVILHFERTAPHQPNAAAGQIYRFDDPFSIVYLNAQQHAIVKGTLIALPVATLLIILAGIIALTRKLPLEE